RSPSGPRRAGPASAGPGGGGGSYRGRAAWRVLSAGGPVCDRSDRNGCPVGCHQRNRTIRHRARTRGVPAGSGRRRRPGAARGTVDVRRAARARPRSAVDRAGAQVLLEQRERDVLPGAVVEVLRSAACLVDHLVLAHRRPGWLFRFGGVRLGLLGRGRGALVSPAGGAPAPPLPPPERPSACPGVVCPRAPPWPWPASAARTRRSQPCGSACCGAPGPAGVPGPAAPRPGACAPPAAGPLPDEQVSAHSPPTTSLT